jgi:YfiH family protein
VDGRVTLHGAPPTHLTFAALEALGLPHLSTTRHCPGIAHPSEPAPPVEAAAAPLLARHGLDPARVAFLRQVHGARVRRVDGALGGLAGVGDALWTATPGVPLAIFTADCLAVVLHDPAAGRLGLVHVGWRGTVRGALRAAVAALRAAGTRPADLVAAVSPSIGPCCYEVDGPVLEPLARAFPDQWRRWVTPAGPGRGRLDLWAANHFQLVASGVPAERIVNPRLCTGCRRDLFFSYRREGSVGRLLTLAALPAPS